MSKSCSSINSCSQTDKDTSKTFVEDTYLVLQTRVVDYKSIGKSDPISTIDGPYNDTSRIVFVDMSPEFLLTMVKDNHFGKIHSNKGVRQVGRDTNRNFLGDMYLEFREIMAKGRYSNSFRSNKGTR